MYKYTNQWFESLTDLLEKGIDEYVIVLFYAMILWLLTKWLQKLNEKQGKKRKDVMDDMEELKKTFAKEEALVIKTGVRFVDMMNFNKTLDEEETKRFRSESLALVKKHQSKPIWMVINFVIQTFLFLFFLNYFRQFSMPDTFSWLPWILPFLSIAAYINKKNMFIQLIFSGMGFFIYPHLSTGVIVFLAEYGVLKLIDYRVIKPLVQRRKKSSLP